MKTLFDLYRLCCRFDPISFHPLFTKSIFDHVSKFKRRPRSDLA